MFWSWLVFTCLIFDSVVIYLSWTLWSTICLLRLLQVLIQSVAISLLQYSCSLNFLCFIELRRLVLLITFILLLATICCQILIRWSIIIIFREEIVDLHGFVPILLQELLFIILNFDLIELATFTWRNGRSHLLILVAWLCVREL